MKMYPHGSFCPLQQYIRSNVPDRVLPAAVEVPCALKDSILGNHAAAQFGRSIHHVLRDFLRWLRRKSLCLSTIQPVPQELGIAPSRTFNEDAWISTHRICSVVYIQSNVPDRVLPAAVEVPCALRLPSLATTLPLSSVDRSTMFYRDFLRWLRRKSLCLSTIQPVPQELGIAPSRTFNEDAWISAHRICSVVYIRSNVPDRVLPAAVEVPCA